MPLPAASPCASASPESPAGRDGSGSTARMDTSAPGGSLSRWQEALEGIGRASAHAGDGARLEAGIGWRQSIPTKNGHTLIAENHSGSIRFTDPQAGDDDVFGYFSRTENGCTKCRRIGDAQFSFQARGCF